MWPDEQRYFFDVVMAAKDAWGASFCCGTSSVIRFDILRQIGGFPTESVTEDYLVTLKMKAQGYRTVYLNERLSLGLAPEGLKEYVTQRSRWALGFVQICRGELGPFRRNNGLTLLDRVSLDRNLPLLVRELFVPPARYHRADPLLALQHSRGPGRRRRHALLLSALTSSPRS